MRQPNRVIAGIDEVGRGPLAGPVVAVAVCLLGLAKFKSNLASPRSTNLGKLRIRDSKKLTAKRREELYSIFLKHPEIAWGIGRTYPKVIDRINIYRATQLAMQRAVWNLEKKLATQIDHLILDGNMLLSMQVSQEAIVKADEKVLSCTIASIIAKVKRDKLMQKYHKQYPQYGFHLHKGYGTRFHLAKLKKHGPCPIHRKTFLKLGSTKFLAKLS